MVPGGGGGGGGGSPAGRSALPPPPATPSLGQLVRSGLRLLVWGRSDLGQLGLQAPDGAGGGGGGGGGGCMREAVHVPTPVESLADKDVVGLAGGAFHSAFVTADGELYSCGCNDNWQLGRRTPGGAGADRPARVTSLESYNVMAAGCGASHTLVLTEQGAVLGWGGNEFGQTGCGAEGPDQHQPRLVKGLGEQRVVRLAVGANHALLLTGSGGVFALGQGSFGALGLGDGLLENRPAPVPVLPLMPLGVVQVAAGDTHSAALTADGRLFTWGRGRHGQLGQGDWASRARPTPLAALRGMQALQVSCGGDHTLVRLEVRGEGGGAGGGGGEMRPRGVVYSFGRGTWGATGLGTTDNICRPSRVPGLEGEDVVQVAAGSRHSLVLTASQQVFAFGNNDFGQLGLEPSEGGTGGDDGGGGDGGGGGGRCVVSPRLVTTLPPLAVLAVLAAGDGSAALLQGSRAGEVVRAGPHHGRRAGLHLTPYDLPDLRYLAAVAATASEEPRTLRDLITATEEIISSPGYVLAAFADRSGGGGGAAAGSGSPVGKDAAATAAGPAAAVQPHGMDVAMIKAIYEALLRLYSRDVVASLGNSLMRLLDALLLQIAAPSGPGPGSRPPSGGGPSPGPVGGLGAAAAAAAVPSLRSFGTAAVADSGGSGRLALLRVLFVVFQCPLLSGSGLGPGLGSSLASRLISITLRLPSDELQLLCAWLVSLPPEVLGGRVVRPLQRYLGELAEGAGPGPAPAGAARAPAGLGPESSRSELLAAARLVAALHTANAKAGGKLPFAEFYNPTLSTRLNLRSEYILWLEVAGGGRPAPPAPGGPLPPGPGPGPLVSMCQVPCLLTPEAKSRILQGEALIQKEAEMSASAREALLQGLHPISAVLLDISVRRTSILADAAQQLAGRPAHHLKRPLRVSFVSQGVAEEGVDQGGVSREFFQLLVAEIFQPQYGMFTYDEESRTFWFNVAAAACLDDGSGEFRLVGLVLGLAIYNGVILDVHLPQAVYKKLLGEPVGLADLEEAFPTLGRSLRAVLAMDPDLVEDALCRNFEVQYDYFGEQRTVPLVPGGSSIPVTGANRELYVQRLVEWTLHESVETQFRAFAYGFHQVCGGPALSLFRHEELELLICGLPHLDFGALEDNARYEGGYHKHHPTVVMLWQVISELDLDQKRRFLAFTTGCDRAPVAGLGALVLVIQRAGPDTERLPSAHTCFNALLLPEYSSRDKLRAKLLTAIENAQGFGLK